MKKLVLIALPANIACAVSLAHADGVDTVAYFTRVGWSQSTLDVIVTLIILMVLNYGLNWVVIGWPAIRLGAVSVRRVTIGLIALTLLGQVADRLGALLAVPLSWLAMGVMGLRGEGSWVVPLIVANFVVSGVAVGMLAFHFLQRRWHGSRRWSWSIALTAAILTNPAWALGLWFVM